jgi:CRP-like cAMP-binding protein
MMDPKDLERLPLFAGLDKRELARVAQHADEVEVSAGRRLAVEGDLAYEFFVIREGTADVDIGGEVKNTLGPGDFFGEIGVLESDLRRVASVTATAPLKLVVMTGYDLRAINRDMSEVASKLRTAIQERVGGKPS